MKRQLALVLTATSLCGTAAAQSTQPSYELSALFNGNFQVRSDDAARALTGGEPFSRFDVARVYLTVRAPIGDDANVRITTDVYQNASDGYYGGLAIRLKYAILQHDLTSRLFGVQDLAAVARAGMLQTVVIEHEESFWPRWIGPVALETNGFFSSSDIGAAMHTTFPRQMGEAYLHVVNGSGYANAETDRFKDIGFRVSLTPFAADSGWWRSFAISPWFYKGWNASQFADVNPGEVGTVADGLQKDRLGIFTGFRDRRVTAGLTYAQRLEELEGGANTVVSPRSVSDRTSALLSTFLLVRPFELANPDRRSRLMLYGRFDRFGIDTEADARNDFLIAGLAWELHQRLNVAVDYQGLTANGGSTTTPARTWAFRWTASF
jgi:hypothetical protein